MKFKKIIINNKNMEIQSHIIINFIKENGECNLEKLIKIFENIKLDINHNDIDNYLNSNIKEIIKNDKEEIRKILKEQTYEIIKETENEISKIMNNSSKKGRLSENRVEMIIEYLYPSSEVKITRHEAGKGDLQLIRQDKKSILIENKDYAKNVNKDEITKFINDVRSENMNGILLSQNSGITNKNNFQIEITEDNNVIIYLHCVNYDYDKIKVGIDILDFYTENLLKVDIDETSISISKNKIEEYNIKLKSALERKEELIKTLKEFNKNMNKQIKDFVIPSLF